MKVTYKNKGNARSTAVMNMEDAEKYAKKMEDLGMTDVKIVE